MDMVPSRPCLAYRLPVTSEKFIMRNTLHLQAWHAARARSPLQRMEAKLNKRAPNGCWEWTGGRSGNGYGVFHLTVDGKETSVKTNRQAYRLYVGEIPEGMYVLHRCDNRACCNPSHLYLGDHAQNMRDMTERNRAANGERHAKFIRTEGMVDRAKDLFRQGFTRKTIAKWLMVDFSTVKSILG